MRTKLALAAVVASLVGFVVPVTSASADQGDTLKGGCGLTNGQTSAVSGEYEGYIYVEALSQEASGTFSTATIACWIDVNGYEQPGTRLTTTGSGVIENSEPITFSTSGRVQECQQVTFADGSTWTASDGNVGTDCPDVIFGPGLLPAGGPPDTITGGCGSATAGNAALTGSQYQGVIYDLSFTEGANRAPSDATVDCWIDVNNSEQSGTRLTVKSIGVQAGQKQISFSANATARITLCQSVTYTDGSYGGGPSCTDVLPSVLPPPASGDTMTGGCGAAGTNDQSLTGGVWEGVIYDASFTQGANGAPSGATVECWIDDNGSEVYSTAISASGTGVQENAQEVAFLPRSIFDQITVCQKVTYADNTPAPSQTCTPVTQLP